MRRSLLPTMLSVVLAVALAAGCTGRTGTDNVTGSGSKQNGIGTPDVGVFARGDREPAPTLRGRTLEDADLDLADFRGKVVVVNFWAQWCAPCRAEARNLNSVYAQTKDLGVEFVGINIKDDRTAAKAFQRSKKVLYPSLFDQPGSLLLKFRGQAPQQPPTTLILDRQGRVAARFIGAVTENQLLIPVQVLAKEST